MHFTLNGDKRKRLVKRLVQRLVQTCKETCTETCTAPSTPVPAARLQLWASYTDCGADPDPRRHRSCNLLDPFDVLTRPAVPPETETTILDQPE